MRKAQIIVQAVAFLVLLAVCFILPNCVEAVMVDEPWGIYAEEGRV